MHPVSFLFVIVIDFVMGKAMHGLNFDVKWINNTLIDFDFTGDIAFLQQNAGDPARDDQYIEHQWCDGRVMNQI